MDSFDGMTLSIITVCYNAKVDLIKTVESVLAQSFNSIEYIIVDGGSTDGTLEYFREVKALSEDRSLSFTWTSGIDAGIYDAMNKGLEMAHGNWVLFLNAGDVLHTNRTLTELFSVVDNQDIIYGDTVLMPIGKRLSSKKFSKYSLLFWGTRVVCHQSIFVKREICPKYDLSYALKGELNWYYDLAVNGNNSVFRYPGIVTEYALGGLGEQRIYENLRETMRVNFKRFGFLAIISIPSVLFKLLKTKGVL